MPVEMTGPEAKDRAKKANQELEKFLSRRVWVRVACSAAAVLMAGLTSALAIQAAQGTVYYVLVAFAASALSLIFGILFLDAWEHRREVRKRNWKTVAPFFHPRPLPSAEAPAGTVGRAAQG